MRKIFVLAALAMLVIAFTSFDSKQATGTNTTAFNDSLDKDRAKYIAIVLEKIKGKENLPVDSVFKNLKMFKGMPANRLLAIMNIGYSKSLGVSCGHCHNTDDFASDEKKQKEITRQMAAMNKEINNNLLKNITGLQSSPAVINCTTCHRGQIKPALDLEKK
ncbi:MAG: c-type cytochrome [Bacteroidota bacterium]|nr:c-type cytochrome [Bacteroidota bacterium]